MRFADLSGVTIHFAFEGHPDGIPLVFVHSLGTDLRIWDDMMLHFADKYSILRYDLRGHGLSACPSAPCSIQRHVDDLAALLDFTHIDSAILVGISVGGQIAMGYAAACPERVKMLVLCDTGTTIGTAQMWNDRIETLRARGMEHLGEALLARWFTPTFASEQPAAYRGYYYLLTRTSVAGYTATCEALRDADMTDIAQLIKAKTLVLCGSEDVSTPPDVGRALAARVPGARFHLIDGAAHLPCVEQSDRFALAIKQFLQESDYAG